MEVSGLIDYSKMSMSDLNKALSNIQAKLDSNPLDARSNAEYKTIASYIRRKHVEELTGVKQK